ncbi:hypothetical protein VTJ49DRAFT_6294 [Mycothermus thermophilus]|uniref:chitinase n=1 Tax=Humicola insolens TaxID=85995 RepID=A0ABR3V1L3_HUMIN
MAASQTRMEGVVALLPKRRPAECPVNTDALKYKRRVAYYTVFGGGGCPDIEPEDILVSGLTDINVAFINFGSDFKLIDLDGGTVARVAALRRDHPALHVSIAVGGWDFNEGATADYWSRMASTYPNRQIFIRSVVDYLKKYGLNGIDLDWEYPVDVDRAGHPEDYNNFVLLLSQMRKAFDVEDPGWTITVTLPTSYWYLRNFDVERLQSYVSWFNLMSYDLHGMWDYGNKWTGPYLKGHTDLEEIDLALDLLWRNNIKPENVVLGFGFYGRSFTMADPNCFEPNGICRFTTGGDPGTCSRTRGVLTYQEVWARNSSSDTRTYYDPKTTVKYTVFGRDQWISYDDAQSFHDKKVFLSKRCLGGLMVWALNQDNANFDAYHGLLGDVSHLELDGGDQTAEEQEELAKQMAAYTGQNCYVTTRCTDGSSGQRGSDQVCSGGFQSIATAHAPLQLKHSMSVGETCKKGWFKHICCPRDAAPKNCEWIGAPERNVFGCSGRCGRTQFKLNIDTAIDAKGQAMCYSGTRALCCDSTAMLSDCYWTDCHDLRDDNLPECKDGFRYQARRLNKPDGTRWCSDEFKSSDHERYGSGLCCPDSSAFSNCHWSNDPGRRSPAPAVPVSLDHYCTPRGCQNNQIKVADALDPPKSSFLAADQTCDAVLRPPGYDGNFPLCCDPPTRFNKKVPIQPSKLFPTYYDEPNDSDLLWHYNDDYSHNNRDTVNDDTEDGKDAFGFIMLNGPEGSLDNSFATTYTFINQKRDVPKVKRSLITYNQTVLDSVFDNATQVLHVYCNYPAGSPECERIWIDGAEDTIIRLPNHVGEGPFARVVSMKPASSRLKIPRHHLEHRSVDGLHENPVYEVVIDYNFADITPKRADEPVFLRIDYSNMLTYWEEIMEADPAAPPPEEIDDPAPPPDLIPGTGRRTRRRLLKRHTTDDWHSRVHRAAKRHKTLRKRAAPVNISVPMDPVMARNRENGTGNQKRWFGPFGRWLQKVTTVEKSELGVLPLGWANRINLFRAQWGCPGQTFSANLRMDLEAELNMDATYAYYFVGSFIPPSKPDVYAYLGMEPYAYLGLHMEGNAIMQMTSGRKRLIDTLAYPGLAIKGIAAVGPTLDVFGEIRGKITLHGQADAGVRLNFGKAEVYWPQNDEASKKYEKLLGMERSYMRPEPSTLAPTLEAGVRLDAQLDIIVEPQANIGIKIGGSSLVTTTIVDAELSGYVRGDLSFQASSDIGTDTGAFRYTYGVYLFYNLGYTATAKILGLIDWALSPRTAWPQDQRLNLYGPVTGEIPLTKRSLELDGRDGHGVDYAVNNSILLPRADGDGSQGSLNPNQPAFTQNLQCPPGGSAPVKLPELRFNCERFGRTAVTPIGGGQPVQVPGMCEGWRSMNNPPTTLTYAPDVTEVNRRRNVQCPKGFCDSRLTALKLATNIPFKTGALSCDEAPWASTEEGGGWLPAVDRAQTCVPSFMNSAWGGNCQQMVNMLETNWGRLDPTIPEKDKKDYWVPWPDAKSNHAWDTAGFKVGDSEQRLVAYPQDMPPPQKIGYNRPSNKFSWMFRRNYTWSVIDNSAQASQWWGATSRQFTSPGNTGPAGHQYILCALNTFGQDNLFRIGSSYKHNGYCVRDQLYHERLGWPNVPRTSRCKITFGAATKKRRSDGMEYDDWEVLNITYVD